MLLVLKSIVRFTCVVDRILRVRIERPNFWGTTLFNFDNLTNPVVLGQAIGAFVVLAGLATIFAVPAKRVAGNRFALAVGFLLVGCLGTAVGAFTFSYGNDPVWSQAAFLYGFPSILAAAAALLIGVISREETTDGGTGGRFALAYLVLAVAALFGSVGSMLDEYYTDDERMFSDPLMKGFAAIEDKYPARWSELKEQIRGADLTGTGNGPEIGNAFFTKHQMEFFRLASDESAIALQKHATRKLDYLSSVDPEGCLSLTSGKPIRRLSESVSYELKLEEAELLAALIQSSSSGSSGTASAEEAESVFVASILQFADENPEAYLAYMAHSNGEAVDPEAACSAWVGINRNLEERSSGEYARFLRSDLWLDPTAELSDDAANELAMGFLYADAAVTRRDLPSRIDPNTILVNAVFADTTYRYIYKIEGISPTAQQFQKFFETESLPMLCANEELKPIIDFGVTLSYEYQSGDEWFAVLVDSPACASGTVKMVN